ncbi:MAG: hypothetical protein Q9218_004423 [Villophora microphyllina]
MKISGLVVPFLGLVALGSASLAQAQRQVLVTYPDNTPPSIIQEAKKAIVAAGGEITKEYSFIKSFAATVSDEVLSSIHALSEPHRPIVEDDGTVNIQKQAPLE